MDFSQKSNHIYLQLLDLIGKNKHCVLATVTSTQGSTPQKPGCSAIFSKKKLLAGTVGGGVVELAIGELASKAIRSGKTGYYRFDLDNDITDLEAAICGGGMSILIDGAPAKHIEVFETLRNSVKNRIPGVLVTFCGSGSSKCNGITRIWITSETMSDFKGKVPEEILSAVKEMLDNSNPNEFREIVLKDSSASDIKMAFLESVVPHIQLIIAGAGHVGKALSHLAKLLDFEVTVWDDRPEFTSKTNLPDADKILSGSIEESLGNIKVDRDSFIVIVTRGHKGDADVLKQFIGSTAGYIGMIGSRRKIAQMRESFLDNRWATVEQWEKIYSPVGLEIGSKTVQEIAVSIAAQLIQVRNQLKAK
jgi:xanthine dehydrogenase accessory factor